MPAKKAPAPTQQAPLAKKPVKNATKKAREFKPVPVKNNTEPPIQVKAKPKETKEQAKELKEKKKMLNKTQEQRLHPGHAEHQELKPVPDKVNKMVTVHLVPFSRTDVGFKKTVDEYYTGSNQNAHHASVMTILSSAVEALAKDPERRFTFSEVKFLQMWYTRQDEETKDLLRQLIKNGQFEVAGGGWTSTDEASPSYEDLLNNMMIGHQFLYNEFGVTPRIGWNLEAAGHSAANARLFAQLGYEALFFSLVDWDLKDKMGNQEEQGYNFIWRPFSKHFGDQYQILSSVLKDNSCYPGGTYSDANPKGDQDPFVDDEQRSDYNAPDKAQEFIHYVEDMAKMYRETHLMIPMGCDFAYENAGQNFKKMEALVSYIERNFQNISIKFQFSTPSEYIEEVKQEKLKYPVFYGDLLPYGKGDEVYSGGFTSRPALKQQIKDGSALFHSHSKLFAQRMLNNHTTLGEVSEILRAKDGLLDALSILNDHNSISGEIREAVVLDNEHRLGKAIQASHRLFSEQIRQEAERETKMQIGQLETCMNGSSNGNDTVLQCPVSKDQNKDRSFLVIVHNS